MESAIVSLIFKDVEIVRIKGTQIFSYKKEPREGKGILKWQTGRTPLTDVAMCLLSPAFGIYIAKVEHRYADAQEGTGRLSPQNENWLNV